MLYYLCMKNMNKNLILGLGIALAILAILVIGSILIPTPAHAEYATYRFSSGNNNAPLYPTQRPEPITVYQPVYQTQPVVYKTQPIVYQTQPVVYQDNSQNYQSGPQAETVNTTVSDKNTATGVDAYGNLTANSVFGRFSFMPSGLMQWILLAIFILVIVILVRKVSGKDEEYHHSPLKHA